MRTWIIALAALLVLPAVGAAATIAVPPVPEQLVEGHTVFTVIEVRNATNITQEEFHAAVAVLVREIEQRVNANRFPGVLWFNDQYLVNPTSSLSRVVEARYPCTGAVLGVDVTAADPRPNAGTVNPLHVDLGGNYVESYHITDPNDRVWDVDKWLITGDFVWTVAMKNNQAGYNVPDDGESNCAPYSDMGCDVPGVNDIMYEAFLGDGESDTRDNTVKQGSDTDAGGFCKYRYKDPATNGYGYPCGQDDDGIADPPNGHYNCPNLQYNALLYFRIQDLASAGDAKDHEPGTADSTDDVSGCHPSYGWYGEGGEYPGGGYSGPGGSAPPRVWPCPDGDDDREGNSHPYNPELPWPLMSYAGRYNHGGSGGDCDGDGVVDQPTEDIDGVTRRNDYTGDYLCHATRNINLYFHHWQAPTLRDYYLIDVVGSAAPYHCHDAREVCDFGEFVAGPDGAVTDGQNFAGDQPYG